MLLTKNIKVRIDKNNIEHYKNKGFDVQIGKSYIFDVWDLPDNSSSKVEIQCDYCKNNIIKRSWKRFLEGRKYIDKDACFECRHKKEQEVCMEKFGVKSVLSLEEVQEKGAKTRKEKYGSEIPAQNSEILQKMKNTMIKRYGEDNPQKIEEFKEKSKQTNLKKYGVENVLQNGPLRESFYYKSLLTKELNKNISYSKAQKYISDLLKGEINCVIANKYIVDVLFREEKIYLEYDGTGHKANVTMGQISIEDFKDKERKRYFAIKKEGYKLFRVINEKNKNRDKLPKDEILINMKKLAFNYLLNQNENFIIFNLDEKIIKTKYKEIKWDWKNDELPSIDKII